MRHALPTGINNASIVTIERFISHVRVTDGCWLWQASTIRGYGCFSIGGRTRLAHRIMVELLTGEIPQQLVVDHVCKTPLCVRPSHLRAVTQKENVNSGIRHKPKSICSSGHELTDDNLIVRPSGWRSCRTCKAAAQRRWRTKVKKHA